MSTTPTIPVICDRCRTIGNSGEGDFSHLGDLLAFTPVVRRKRLNGWDAEAQRAFIAALAMTGSKTAAAKSLGRNAFGIDQLLKAEGSESFRVAFDRAQAIAEKNGAMRIATGVADAAARNKWLDQRSALRGLEPAPEPTLSEEQHWDIIESLATKFMKKVAAERQARVAGQIVAADFYLRQVTFMEVMFDLTSTSLGFDPGDALKELRRGGHRHRDIVGTSFSDWLDESRRRWWEEEGDPERPKHPDVRFLAEHRSADGDPSTGSGQSYSTYAEDSAFGAKTTPARGFTQEQWKGMSTDEQRAAREGQYEEDAEEQRAWEAKARAEFEARQSAPPPSAGEGQRSGAAQGEGA